MPVGPRPVTASLILFVALQLRLKCKHRLDGKEGIRLSGWLESCPALATAYGIKEAGYRIHDAKIRDKVDTAFED
jgi:hypothetical protein